MDYETIQIIAKEKCDYIIWKLSETRPEEILIIAMLAVSIGIGAAILINQRKIKKQLKELLDQKEDKPNGKEDCSN